MGHLYHHFQSVRTGQTVGQVAGPIRLQLLGDELEGQQECYDFGRRRRVGKLLDLDQSLASQQDQDAPRQNGEREFWPVGLRTCDTPNARNKPFDQAAPASG